MPNRDVSIRLSLKDGDKVERGLNRLGKEGQSAFAKIEKGGAPASRSLLAVNAAAGELRGGIVAATNSLGPLGAGLISLGPLGLGIGVVATAMFGLVRASARAAGEIANIKDQAEQAGTAIETFQELTYAAEQYSVTQEALTDGLKELNLRADEFVKTGGGSAAEAFARIGFTQTQLQGQLGDTGELFLDVVKRIKSLESEAARIRVADEIFGGQGGEQFVRLIAASEAEVRGLMDEARELGYVIDEGMVRNADAMRDNLNQSSKLISLQLNSALLSLAPLALEVAEIFADLARWVGQTVDDFRELENKSLSGIKREAADLTQEIIKLEEHLARLEQMSAGNPALRATSTRGLAEDIEAKRQELELLQALIRQTERGPNRPVRAALAPVETSDQKSAREKIAKTIADLKFELDQLGSSDFDQKMAEKLRGLGLEMETLGGGIVSFSDDRAAMIYDLSRSLADAAEKEKAYTEAKKQGDALAESLLTTEEARKQRLTEIQTLLEQGVITEETAARARVQANQEAADAIAAAEEKRVRASTDAVDGIRRALEDIRDASRDTASQWEEDIQGMNSSARSAFVDITLGAKTMAEGLEGIFNDLAQRVAGRLYDRSIGSGIDAILDSFFTQTTSTAHTGGVVGSGLAGRQVNPAVFAGAPRFHSGGMVPGLRPGETPIIALRNERVLTEAQQDNTAKTIAGLAAIVQANSRGAAVNVNVYNNAGGNTRARTESRQNGSGGLDFNVIFEEVESRIWGNVARGEGGAPVLEGRYGMDPAVGARR